MSLTGALYNAFSGIKANSRAAELVSTNIANATTEGYGARELSLTSGALGTTGGVRIAGVIRHSDPVIIADRRASDADLAYSSDISSERSTRPSAIAATPERSVLNVDFAPERP